MIQKVIVLLIICICFFPQFDDFVYSIEKHYLYSSTKKSKFIYNDNNDIFSLKNSLNISFSLLKCNKNFNITNIYFKLFNYSYIFNLRFNIIQVKYNILFHYKNLTLISPSDLCLHHDLHLICHIRKIESNFSVDSLAYIQFNKYFQCIEYINLNERNNFGIKIYKPKNGTSCINFTKYFFSDNIFNYKKHFYKTNKLFQPSLVERQFYLNNKSDFFGLKRLYIKKPQYNTTSHILVQNNTWNFVNIYNYYFCFCRGNNCLYQNLLNIKNTTQICKYRFYLNLIEENKNLYNKTDYLLADFPGDFQSLDDAYPIYKKLISLGKNAYYMTINKILIKYKNNNNNLYNHIIQGNYIHGDFLEKHFSLFLRLKAVISGAEYFSFNNLFYYMEYITFISLTHGLNYFKTDLFQTYYGNNTYNKLVISTSEKLISLAIQNGWKEQDLIKICLPKWDRLDAFKNKKFERKNKSIFFFFTWRKWHKNTTDEVKLKSDYFQNIKELMNNEILKKILNNDSITSIFCFHHMLDLYKNKLNFGNNKIKFIKQNEIFHYIKKSNLLVTDFSSIIFEFMYQNKPYVMFIPDSEDPNISKYYSQEYINLVKDLREDKIKFMNKFFNINQAVNKIIYYIENDFQVEKNLSDFYQSFNLTCGNNTMKFINYLENL